MVKFSPFLFFHLFETAIYLTQCTMNYCYTVTHSLLFAYYLLCMHVHILYWCRDDMDQNNAKFHFLDCLNRIQEMEPKGMMSHPIPFCWNTLSENLSLFLRRFCC